MWQEHIESTDITQSLSNILLIVLPFNPHYVLTFGPLGSEKTPPRFANCQILNFVKFLV